MSAPQGCGANGAALGVCGKDDTLARLQDTIVYGLKGISAYRYLANTLNADCKPVDDVISEALYFTLTNVNFHLNNHLAMAMKVGQAAVQMMQILDETHTETYGIPTPATVSQNQAEGKAILVSGHDLLMMKKLLEQTEGQGINVYTHSEMLPAHGYPELRKYSHLKGNIGKSWFDQSQLFETFSGAIIVNTNCIVPPKKSTTYMDRLFGIGNVGIEGYTPIENYDFTPVIEKALALPDVNMTSEETMTTGFNWRTVLSLADIIVDAVKAGKIRRFFVIAGCDAPGKAGDYYRNLALNLPKDCVVLTTSCGKFRFNDHDFGTIEGTDIPRYIDLGQCNDSGGAVQIALALAKAFDCSVNELPLSIVLSWMEQKAVAILLGLLSLDVKNVYVGPKAPEFFNSDILDVLVTNYDLHLTGEWQSDLARMLGEEFAFPYQPYRQAD